MLRRVLALLPVLKFTIAGRTAGGRGGWVRKQALLRAESDRDSFFDYVELTFAGLAVARYVDVAFDSITGDYQGERDYAVVRVVLNFHGNLVAFDLALLDGELVVLASSGGAGDFGSALLQDQHDG